MWSPQRALTVGDVPAHRGAVEDVVVDQRGRVDHLDDGAEDVMGRRSLAAGAGGQQQQDGPQPFAAVVPDVIDDGLDLGIAALQCLRQDALDFFQVRRDGGVQVERGAHSSAGPPASIDS